MVTRTTTYDYEQSSESGRERMLPVPWTRLTDTTPTLGDPAQVTSAVAGSGITGTVVNPGVVTIDPVAVLNAASGAIFRHNVRNVLTYAGGPAEASWQVLNVGDVVYYDVTCEVINAGIKLSVSPLNAATANAIFGNIVMMQDEDAADFPKGGAGSGSTHVCAILQA